MRIDLKWLLVCLLCLSVSFAGAQSNWTLKTQKDGIKVYQSPVADSKVNAVKVLCEFEATPAALVAVLMDVKSCTEWVYHTKSCTLVKQNSPWDVVYHSEINLPWPVENRDFVAHLWVTQDPKTHIVIVEGPAIPGVVAERKGIFRIAHSKGRWVINPINSHTIVVEYTLQVDPGGNIPAWLVNMFAAEGPIQSFKGLRLQLQKSQYQNARLPEI